MTNYYQPEIQMEIFNKTPSFIGGIGSVKKKRLQTRAIACEKFIPTLKRFHFNQDIPKNCRPDYHSPKSFPVADKWRLWRPWQANSCSPNRVFQESCNCDLNGKSNQEDQNRVKETPNYLHGKTYYDMVCRLIFSHRTTISRSMSPRLTEWNIM